MFDFVLEANWPPRSTLDKQMLPRVRRMAAAAPMNGHEHELTNGRSRSYFWTVYVGQISRTRWRCTLSRRSVRCCPTHGIPCAKPSQAKIVQHLVLRFSLLFFLFYFCFWFLILMITPHGFDQAENFNRELRKNIFLDCQRVALYCRLVTLGSNKGCPQLCNSFLNQSKNSLLFKSNWYGELSWKLNTFRFSLSKHVEAGWFDNYHNFTTARPTV